MSLFFYREVKRVLSTRAAFLVMFAMAYALLSFPVVVKKPPPELRAGLEAWFGSDNLGLRLVLFAWFDLVMNKLAIFSAAILGAGIITDERSTQTLDIFLSKPITMKRYFMVKAMAAASALGVLYIAVTALAAVYFSVMLADFSWVAFLRMSAVHVFCAMFAAFFAALMAVLFGHKLSAMLATVAVLSVGVGLAFAGFYQPAWAHVFALNPISQGVSLIATAEHATLVAILKPIAALVVTCALVFGMGTFVAGRLESRS